MIKKKIEKKFGKSCMYLKIYIINNRFHYYLI